MSDHPKNRFSDKGWVIVSKAIITLLVAILLGWTCWVTAQGLQTNRNQLEIVHNTKSIEVNVKKIEELQAIKKDTSEILKWVNKQ